MSSEEQTRAMTHVHIQVAIRFCFQIDARNMGADDSYLDAPGKTAYEQLLRACLADPHTRQRLLLYLAVQELEDIGGGHGGQLYSLLSGEEPAPPDTFGQEQSILQPHLMPNAPYSYWATEAGETDDLDIEPLNSAIACRIIDISVAEIGREHGHRALEPAGVLE
jgi:hypothetical protein